MSRDKLIEFTDKIICTFTPDDKIEADEIKKMFDSIKKNKKNEQVKFHKNIRRA
jgi:hypothetical protein